MTGVQTCALPIYGQLAQWSGIKDRRRQPLQRTRENECGKRGWRGCCCRSRNYSRWRSRRGGLCFLDICRRTGTCEVAGGIGRGCKSCEDGQNDNVAYKAMEVYRNNNGSLSFISVNGITIVSREFIQQSTQWG